MNTHSPRLRTAKYLQTEQLENRSMLAATAVAPDWQVEIAWGQPARWSQPQPSMLLEIYP